MITLPASGHLGIAAVGRYMYPRLDFTHLPLKLVFLPGGCGGGLYPGPGLQAQMRLSFVLGCGREGPLPARGSAWGRAGFSLITLPLNDPVKL